MGTPQESEETRRRLIEAAGEVFAEEGFAGATVRTIAAKAAANLGAINYHFGDKDSLYQAVIRHAVRSAFPSLFDGLPDPSLPAAQRLEMVVRRATTEALRPQERPWIVRLLQREKLAPTPIFMEYFEREIKPMCLQILPSIVGEMLGLPGDDAVVRMLVFSIVSQFNFYRYERELVAQVYPEFFADPQMPARVVDHLVRASLAIVRAEAMRLGKTESVPPVVCQAM